MKQKISKISLFLLLASLLLAACGSITFPGQVREEQKSPVLAPPQQSQPSAKGGVVTSISGYETALENIYSQVNPSVVSIRVVQQQAVSVDSTNQTLPFFNMPGFPNFFGAPDQNNPQVAPQYSQAVGSGFVWSKDGYIVTNNHVVSGADKIEVKFYDGTTLSAKLIGADPDSDLAVIQVDNPGFTLTPIMVSDSSEAKVGQIVAAIGNPFGLENTMTVGIVSALGRTLPAGESFNNGATYSIPDIIQTDAPINPGNSGGPLVNDQGALIGVTSAIESPVRANAGVGFAIPSTIVNRVIPELIKDGKYEHPYVGISGTSLTPDLAKAMDLTATQRGALVEEIVPNSPADKAGLHGSDRQVTIDGQDVNVGGDVITAIDSTPVKSMDDVIVYLADHTGVGQKVTLTILRDGKEMSLDVTLEARATTTTQEQNTNPKAESRAWLGIAGLSLTPEVNKEMNLPQDQTGVLVEQVQSGSPADQAGLKGSYKPVLINGQRVLIGGDVITALDGKPIATFEDLQATLQNADPGQKVQLMILRDGKEQTVTVTLTEHP
jgi:S1-C subfamily serine protease